VGTAGYIVPYGDVASTANAILRALSSDKDGEASDRINNVFRLEQRETEMTDALKNLIGES
jgi:hypothetical protein